MASGGPRDALEILKKSIDFIYKESCDYFPKVLAECCCVVCLSGECGAVIEVGQDVFWRFQQIGSLSAMKSVREIIAACYFKMGSKYKAERVTEVIDRDPLGVEGLYGIT